MNEADKDVVRLLDEYEDLQLVYDELEDSLDPSDFELLEVWERVARRMRRLGRKTRRLRDTEPPSRSLTESIDLLVEEVRDGFAEVRAML